METTPQTLLTCPLCAAPTERRYKKKKFWIRTCLTCGMLFVENPPENTASLYDADYFFGGNACGGYADYDAEKEAMKETILRCLEMLEQEGSKGRLLDIGAATGFFISHASARGWNAEGIDISEAASAIAVTKGRKVIASTLDTASYGDTSFDAVTFFDVLEHISDPVHFMNHISRITKPGGMIMLSTPDTESIYARLMGKRWHLLCPPEHLTFFNKKNLESLLNKSGFDLIWEGRLPKRFTPQYILQTAARWLGLPFLHTIGKLIQKTPIASLPIPLDFRDNIFVLARRR